MARTRVGAQLTLEHRNKQMRIRALALRAMLQVSQLWSANDLDSFDRFAAATASVVNDYRQQSAAAAAAYWDAFRVAEGVSGNAPAIVADRLDPERIARSLRATGLSAATRTVRAGLSPAAAKRNAIAATSGSVGRLVLRGGNDTLVASSNVDSQAVGWARFTGANACAFCAMLAANGPVYRTDATAGFTAHDHDSCTVEPHYEGASWPGDAERYRDEWRQALAEARANGELQRGTNNDALNAYRRFKANH